METILAYSFENKRWLRNINDSNIDFYIKENSFDLYIGILFLYEPYEA